MNVAQKDFVIHRDFVLFNCYDTWDASVKGKVIFHVIAQFDEPDIEAVKRFIKNLPKGHRCQYFTNWKTCNVHAKLRFSLIAARQGVKTLYTYDVDRLKVYINHLPNMGDINVSR